MEVQRVAHWVEMREMSMVVLTAVMSAVLTAVHWVALWDSQWAAKKGAGWADPMVETKVGQ